MVLQPEASGGADCCVCSVCGNALMLSLAQADAVGNRANIAVKTIDTNIAFILFVYICKTSLYL